MEQVYQRLNSITFGALIKGKKKKTSQLVFILTRICLIKRKIDIQIVTAKYALIIM